MAPGVSRNLTRTFDAAASSSSRASSASSAPGKKRARRSLRVAIDEDGGGEDDLFGDAEPSRLPAADASAVADVCALCKASSATEDWAAYEEDMRTCEKIAVGGQCFKCRRWHAVVRCYEPWQETCRLIATDSTTPEEFVAERDLRLQILDGIVERDFFADEISQRKEVGWRLEHRCLLASKTDFKTLIGKGPDCLNRSETVLPDTDGKVRGYMFKHPTRTVPELVLFSQGYFQLSETKMPREQHVQREQSGRLFGHLSKTVREDHSAFKALGKCETIEDVKAAAVSVEEVGPKSVVGQPVKSTVGAASMPGRRLLTMPVGVVSAQPAVPERSPMVKKGPAAWGLWPKASASVAGGSVVGDSPAGEIARDGRRMPPEHWMAKLDLTRVLSGVNFTKELKYAQSCYDRIKHTQKSKANELKSKLEQVAAAIELTPKRLPCLTREEMKAAAETLATAGDDFPSVVKTALVGRAVSFWYEAQKDGEVTKEQVEALCDCVAPWSGNDDDVFDPTRPKLGQCEGSDLDKQNTFKTALVVNVVCDALYSGKSHLTFVKSFSAHATAWFESAEVPKQWTGFVSLALTLFRSLVTLADTAVAFSEEDSQELETFAKFMKSADKKHLLVEASVAVQSEAFWKDRLADWQQKYVRARGVAPTVAKFTAALRSAKDFCDEQIVILDDQIVILEEVAQTLPELLEAHRDHQLDTFVKLFGDCATGHVNSRLEKMASCGGGDSSRPGGDARAVGARLLAFMRAAAKTPGGHVQTFNDLAPKVTEVMDSASFAAAAASISASLGDVRAALPDVSAQLIARAQKSVSEIDAAALSAAEGVRDELAQTVGAILGTAKSQEIDAISADLAQLGLALCSLAKAGEAELPAEHVQLLGFLDSCAKLSGAFKQWSSATEAKEGGTRRASCSTK